MLATQRTGVSDRRLDGEALLQQHLDERGGDVPVPSGHARRLPHLVARRHGRRSLPPGVPLTRRSQQDDPLVQSFLPEFSGNDAGCAVAKDGGRWRSFMSW